MVTRMSLQGQQEQFSVAGSDLGPRDLSKPSGGPNRWRALCRACVPAGTRQRVLPGHSQDSTSRLCQAHSTYFFRETQ